jgi:predicted nuclease with TOPRIM domain
MPAPKKEVNEREELRARLQELAKADVSMIKTELESHDQEHEDLYAERDKLNDQINELTIKRNELAERIAKDHIGRQNELRNKLSQAARDAGGRFLSDVTT